MQGGREYSYANPSPGTRRSAAEQTMALEPESLACSLPGPERHVGQRADTNREAAAAAAAAPRGPPARRGPRRGRGNGATLEGARGEKVKVEKGGRVGQK